MARLLLFSFLFLSNLSYGQSLITSSITSGYGFVEISDELSSSVSSLIGDKIIQSKFFKIIGKNGTIKLNYTVLETRLNANTGMVEGGLNLKVIKVFAGHNSNSNRRYVGFSGTYGAIDVRMEVDFEPSLSAITGSVATIPADTEYRIIITSTVKNKVLFDYSGHSDKGSNVSSEIWDSSNTPANITQEWIEDLGNQNFKSAFSKMQGKQWKNYDWFASSRAYGGITKTEIFNINLMSIDKNYAQVEGDYESIDPANSSGRYTQVFYLTRIYNEWKITRIKTLNIKIYESNKFRTPDELILDIKNGKAKVVFHAFGTEPFWDMYFTKDEALYINTGWDIQVVYRTQSSFNPHLYKQQILYFDSEGKEKIMTVVKESKGDGMSDRIYPFSLSGDFGIGAGKTVFDINMFSSNFKTPVADNSGSFYFNNVKISDEKYSETEDLSKKIKLDYGYNFTIVDWDDLKDIPNINAWIDHMNLKENQTFFVAKGGKYFYGNKRQYYIHYSPKGKPYSGFLAHDQIGNKLFLGSWYNLNMNILLKFLGD